MERNDCSSKKGYVHLKESERSKIEVLIKDGKKAGDIARLLGRDRSTIYREVRRGRVMRERWDRRGEYAVYRAHVGQAGYEERGKNKERGLKIGKDKDLEGYIRNKLIKKFSPDAIIGQIKAEGLRFVGMICTKTLYNYIDAEVFSGISNKDLWRKRCKARRHYRSVGRVSRTNRMCRSIEERPQAVEEREDYGHWEGDTVKGPLGSKASLITLTERKSREEVIIKVASATQEAVKEAIDGLEREYGWSFRAKFKSITFDNGVEFLDWRSLEVSLYGAGRRTTIYFAHAYSSWERGTNENHNGMIRRFVPKGTNIALLDDQEIKDIEDWMNDYPRKILAYGTPRRIAQECLQSDGFGRSIKFCRN